MASSLATATLAASSEAWSHPSSGRGSTSGSGSRTKALNRSPLEPSSTYIPTRFRGHEGPRYWPNANNGCRYWRFGGKSHIRLPLSPECVAVPSISRDPSFGVRLLKQDVPTLCPVIERNPWHLFPLKNQQVGNNRDSPIRDERIDSSRRQPQMNEPELGDSVPMVSSLLTAMPAASNEVWSHPSSCRGGTGSWTKVLTSSPLAPSSTYIPTRFRCHEGPRYWPNANNGGRNWHFGGKLHIGPPGHRGMSLFPPFRATRGSESGRLGWGNQAPVPSSSGTLGISSRSRIRGSATTATPRFTLRGLPPRERGYK